MFVTSFSLKNHGKFDTGALLSSFRSVEKSIAEKLKCLVIAHEEIKILVSKVTFTSAIKYFGADCCSPTILRMTHYSPK